MLLWFYILYVFNSDLYDNVFMLCIYQVYKVLVQVPGKSWFIFRRYNEFNTLHDKVTTHNFLICW